MCLGLCTGRSKYNTVLNKPHHQNIFLCVHKLMDHLEDLETPVSARHVELRLIN